MGDLGDQIRRIHLAFDRSDSRRQDIRDLACAVDVAETALAKAKEEIHALTKAALMSQAWSERDRMEHAEADAEAERHLTRAETAATRYRDGLLAAASLCAGQAGDYHGADGEAVLLGTATKLRAMAALPPESRP